MAEGKSLLNRLFTEPQDGTIRFPALRIIFGPYLLFINKFKEFLGVGAIYTLIISLIYLLGGQALLCSPNALTAENLCRPVMEWFVGTRIIVLAAISMYCAHYYKIIWQNRPFSLRSALTPQKSDLKSFAAFCIFLLLNVVALLSGYLLKIRVPNPDWRIELTYFGIVAIGFLVPFALLRFYVLFAYIWSGEKLISPWKLWKITEGNTLRLLLSFSLEFFIFIFGLLAVSSNLQYWAEDGSYFTVLAGEYIFNFVVLIMFSCFVNFCGLQKIFLTERKTDEETKNN